MPDRNDPMMKAIIGDEFMDQVLGKVSPYPLPTGRGVIPNKRPDTSAPKEMQAIISETVAAVSAYNAEQLQTFLDAMETAIRNKML
jgi:hypothetical protein